MDRRIFYTNKKNCSPNSNEKKPNKIKNNSLIKSLNEVEFFLNDFSRFKRFLHLYKFFK